MFLNLICRVTLLLFLEYGRFNYSRDCVVAIISMQVDIDNDKALGCRDTTTPE